MIDKGFFVLLGNNVLLYQLLKDGRHEEFRNAVAWWLSATKSFTPKLVNPGAVPASQLEAPFQGHVHVFFNRGVPDCLPGCNYSYESTVFPAGRGLPDRAIAP